jgi:hypothetical protein
MSCDEWESGALKLPNAVFSRFRRELNEFYNQRQTRIFNKAVQIHETLTVLLMDHKSPERSRSLEDAVRKHLEEPIPRTFAFGFGFGGTDATRECDGANDIVCILAPYKAAAIVRPKKKDFPLKALSNDSITDGGSWSITIDTKAHTVRWCVSENNHACERAHEHPVASHFFSMLNQIQWVRGTDGEIVGNDEYHRDSCEASGGGNYVKLRFGPDSQHGLMTRYLGVPGGLR